MKPHTTGAGKDASISSLRRLRIATILLVASFVALVVAAGAYSIALQHSLALDSAVRTARNTLMTAEAHARQSFGETARIMAGIADVYIHELTNKGDKPVDEAYLHKVLAAKLELAPEVFSFFILDANYAGVAGSRSFPVDIARVQLTGMSFTDLMPFGNRILLGNPYRNLRPEAPPDQWMQPMGLRVSGADGAIKGYVFALIDPKFFADYFRTLDVGARGRIAMWANNQLIAGTPTVRAALGSPREGALDISDDGLVRNGSTVTDAAARTTIDPLPVTVTVALAAEDFLGPWRASRNTVLLAVTWIVIAMGVFAIIILRQIRRTEENEMALRAAKASAEEANEAKSRFLAHMSHEFRTPLNAIMGFSEIIKNKMLGDQLAPAYASYADHIHRSGEHLLNIVNDILDMAKIESGAQPLQREAINLHNVIGAAVSFVEGLASQKGVRMRTAIPSVLPAVSGDQRFSRQVLINLLSNAIKFSPPGSEIVIAARATEEKHLDICVSDHGPGIEPTLLKRLGEPFLQGNPAVSNAGQGTGLGLSICKRYMDVLGGELLVDSVVGGGTTATIRFPQQLLTAAAAGAPDLKRNNAAE